MHTVPIRAERVLDLSFWPTDRAELGLGGLWEFHAEKLLEPNERHAGSDFLVDISHPWGSFRPNLQQASYVMLIRGLTPRPLGYSLHFNSPQTGTRLIVAPKYAPEKKRGIGESAFCGFAKRLFVLLRQPLLLTFVPRAVDEVWMLIVQRSLSPSDDGESIPRLSVAGDSRAFHPGN